jgi:hypothetical protein
MPNLFKSGNTATNGSIYDGNFTIGVDSTFDFGPTSTTGFWNGITPPSGGYTIYQNKAANGPSIRTAANDSALISILQGLGSTGTTAAGALNWARQQTEIMVANIDYYDIVTSGLTFVVDASYAPSYPRSGTTWYDLTRNGNNVSNTPATWASTLGGTISRSNQTNIFSTLIPSATGTSYTMCAFVNVSGTVNGPGSQIFGTTNTLGPSINVSSSPAMSAITFNSVTVTKPGSDFKQWNYFVGVQSGSTQLFYVNGTLSGTTSATNTSFGAFLNFGYIGAKTVSMTMGSFQLYNRALSQTEVTKNWNALRTRFGL